MSSCSLSYLGGVFDRAAMILCGSDAVTDPVTGWIIMRPSKAKVSHFFNLFLPFESLPELMQR
jgi:hypothetical protein